MVEVMEETVSAVVQLLQQQQQQREECQSALLNLTGHAECVRLLLQQQHEQPALEFLLSAPLSEAALRSLVNVSADADGASALLRRPTAAPTLLAELLSRDSPLSDTAGQVLLNATRSGQLAEAAWRRIVDAEPQAARRLALAAGTSCCYSRTACSHDCLPELMQNLAQLGDFRRRLLLVGNDAELVARVAQFTGSGWPLRRRRGALGLLKNLCFDGGLHESLCDIGVGVDLALPLAGAGDSIDDEDQLKLATRLQFLPGSEAARREPDPECRLLCCEAMLQLCSTDAGRRHLKDIGAYYILREAHKDPDAGEDFREAIERVVDILICDDPIVGDLREEAVSSADSAAT